MGSGLVLCQSYFLELSDYLIDKVFGEEKNGETTLLELDDDETKEFRDIPGGALAIFYVIFGYWGDFLEECLLIKERIKVY